LRILHLTRRGKFILAELEAGMGLAIHLRMTGWLSVVPTSHPLASGSHVRVRVMLDGGECLVFRDPRTFGRFWFGPRAALDALPALAKLGPDALSVDAATLLRQLRAHRGRLKPLLLNQSFLAGIGNIYADEALFRARLHPLASAARVSGKRAKDLHRAIRWTLNAAVRAGGTTIVDFRRPNGEPGLFQVRLRVYGREGLPCLRCGSSVKRIVVGQRGTWFCPRCQKRSAAPQ
jgi:formamidopyrimidine-DNA glycosylase